MDIHMSLLPEAKERIPLADGNLFQKFLRYADFYLMARNPSIVQLELSQDCHFWTHSLPFGVWEIVVSFGPDRSVLHPSGSPRASL